MKSKNLIIIILLFLIVFIFAGCGSKEKDSDKTISFVIGTVETEDSITGKLMREFEEYVETETKGKVDVQIMDNSVLGGEREILEGVELGTIHMALPGSTQFEQYDKKFSILDVPFLFPSLEANEKAWSGELGKTYVQWLNEIGFECYGFVPLGFRGVANSKHTVKTPEDLKGMKIRVMESQNYVDMFNALGANAVPMSYSEVYTALQQGTIDGQDNPPQYNVEAGFYELQPYYTRTNHVMSRMLYITSTVFMDSLDDEIRTIVEKGLSETLAKHQKQAIEADEGYVKQMQAAGIEVIELSDSEMQEFIKKVADIHNSFRKKVGDDIFEMALRCSK